MRHAVEKLDANVYFGRKRVTGNMASTFLNQSDAIYPSQMLRKQAGLAAITVCNNLPRSMAPRIRVTTFGIPALALSRA